MQKQEQKRCFIYSAGYRVDADTQVTQLFGRKQLTFPTIKDLREAVLGTEPKAYQIAISSLSEVSEEDYNTFFNTY